MRLTETPLDISPLDRFREAVRTDEALQLELADIREPERFAATAAARTGLAGLEQALRDATRPDPIGLERFAPAPEGGRTWPGMQWLPVGVGVRDLPVWVDWMHFGGRPLNESFYEQASGNAHFRPFNRLFRYRTTLDDFIADAPVEMPEPDGFIFHMSRCGSTLVSQMLAAMPDGISISEAPPLDAIVQLASLRPDLCDAVTALRAMVAALTRNRSGTTRHRFLKLDSWHTLALPLFRRAFPDTPWVFLHRDPVEVMVSQQRIRGLQTVPGILPGDLFGLGDHPGVPVDDYVARVLAATNQAVLTHWHLGGGLVVDYRELPHAVETRILPHFGITPDAAALTRMAAAAGRDAKAPGAHFAPDSEEKQRAADDAMRLVAATQLGEIREKLLMLG